MKSYWDRLTSVIRAAEILRGSPIPRDDVGERLNLMRLGHVEHELREMLRTVATGVEVWCGDPEDPLRKGRPMAEEFDELAEMT